MGDLNMEDMTLPALFDHAARIRSSAVDSSPDKDTVRRGVEALRRCDEMISKLGLFSSNETKDDIGTTSLKYLLVPFYLGELSEKLADEDRLSIVKVSQDHIKEFVSFCEALEFVPKEEIESSMQSESDFASRRAKKIARFKRQRAAELKLQEIKERKERRYRSLKAAATSTPVEVGEEDIFEDDSEEEREAWLTTISLTLCQAFDLMEMMKKEEEMLSAIKEKQLKDGGPDLDRELLDERAKTAEAWHQRAALRAQNSKPVEPITCAAFAQDVIEGRANVSDAHDHKHQPLIFGPASVVGSRLTSERERMAAQVFQPGHRLPTMSIEEAGLREMEIMNKWQETNARLAKEANSSWYKDERKPSREDEDDEVAVERARAFDDWKDENPRGAGNKKLTPCG